MLKTPLSRDIYGRKHRLSVFGNRTATTDVRGKASPDQADPTVTVQGEENEDPVPVEVTPDAAGNFVREDVPLAEGANAIAVNVTDKYGRTENLTRNVTLIRAAPTFAYDANGNTTGDGLWTYTWNDENRLISILSYPVNPVKIEFTYDGLGRRRTKLVYSWDDNTSAWNETPATVTRFVYDGNNLVAELDGLDDDAILRKYVWGLDLSAP